MQQLLGHSDRTLLPRGLLGRPDFRFDIGAGVAFHGAPAIIRDRSRSAAGRELYTIELAAHDERPIRTVLGDYLHAPYDSPEARIVSVPFSEARRQMCVLPQVHKTELLAA